MTITFRVGDHVYLLEAVNDDTGEFTFTPREWGEIKRLSGVLPMDMQKSFEGGDMELMVALAVVAMRRAGQHADPDRLLDGIDTVEVILPDDDVAPGDAVPPTDAAAAADDPSTTTTTPADTGRPPSHAYTESNPPT